VAVFYYVLYLKSALLTLDVSSEVAGAGILDEHSKLEEQRGYPYLSTVSGDVDSRQGQDGDILKPKIHLNRPGTRSSSRMETYHSPVHQSDSSTSQARDSSGTRPVKVIKSRPRRGPSSSSETEY